jgi:Cu+-exporting ATPase
MKENKNNKQLVRDPVCGMWIEPEDAADILLYKEKIFYFCAPGCKIAFEKEPEKFISENQKNESRMEE